jgi:protease secretion system membrane fusion protein
MDIVPDEQQLIIEARIPPQFIDRLQEGQAVNARFSNFKQSLQVVAPARLLSISGDVLTDANTGEGYYLARVALTPEGLVALEGRSMQPGMPVEVVVLTGSRSLLQYLLHPLTRRLAASLKEE